MRAVVAKIRSVAPARTTVLLLGETGTGKGLMAKLIHSLSSRKEAPFLAVHCGAIPETLLESELFGHEKGAFTGAVRRKRGKFEAADGGTLFLDEVGTMSRAAQVALLNVLQEGQFQRVGGEEAVAADVRLIAATNSDLEQMQRAGTFRADLFYRLNVFPIEVPPLRERIEDIPHLTAHLLERFNMLYGKSIIDLCPEVADAFQHYPWPGNVRELENVLERAYILEEGTSITPQNIPLSVMNHARGYASLTVDGRQTLAAVRRAAIESAERQYLKELLARHGGRIGDSASTAGITSRQLHKLLARYEIHKEDFKAKK
jgi:transcriptional regulator with GAF, ATPase, and Fis domain